MKNKMGSILFLCVPIMFGIGCQTNKTQVIDPRSDLIRYTGRINFGNELAPEIYWPGTSILLKFRGEGIKVQLKDEKGENC